MCGLESSSLTNLATNLFFIQNQINTLIKLQLSSLTQDVSTNKENVIRDHKKTFSLKQLYSRKGSNYLNSEVNTKVIHHHQSFF